jgi:hypothetical protein
LATRVRGCRDDTDGVHVARWTGLSSALRKPP